MSPRFSIDGVGPGTPLGSAAPAILAAKAKPLFGLENAARSGADTDAVHDMRVASRRLREAMRLFAPLFPPKASARWYARIRRVTRALGPVRDSDVFIDAMSRLVEEVGEGGRKAVAFLAGQRLGQREHQLYVLNDELSRVDLRRARKEFAQLVLSVVEGPLASRPLADFAQAAVAERAGLVFGFQPEALLESNVARQHALRILYKRLRYAVEVFALCYGGSFDAVHDVLTDLQDALGDVHDYRLFLDLVSAPDVLAAAGRAEVASTDFAEVRAVLENRAHEAYGRFVALVAEHPAEAMLPALLLPLSRAAEGPMPAEIAGQRGAVACTPRRSSEDRVASSASSDSGGRE